MWTERQRVALASILLIVTAGLGVRYYFNRAEIPNPQPEVGRRAAELADRVDPNTADWPTMAALPQIGPAMARRIVEEREAFAAANPGAPAYRELKDLSRVKGIGPATLANLEPYLVFSPPAPATLPVN
jgi:DNA uptake protein ComE-like DNA-binding protein